MKTVGTQIFNLTYQYRSSIGRKNKEMTDNKNKVLKCPKLLVNIEIGIHP